MGVLAPLTRLLEESPPVYAFEISPAGIAWGIRPQKRGRAPEMDFRALPEGVVTVSPVKENVEQPEALASMVAALAPVNGNKRKREAALVLPDYCARVAILDFESFPSDKNEQASLVRFRMKKTVSFDVDSAALSFHAHKGSGKKVEAIVAAAAVEIVARYEAPFRAAGFVTGFVTTSTLASMNLMPESGMSVLAKRSDRALTVAVSEGRHPKLVRCVELTEGHIGEILAVLLPTFAYAEDELGRRPERMLACGFEDEQAELREDCERELGIKVEPLVSLWGVAGAYNAGLLGWLQAQERAG